MSAARKLQNGSVIVVVASVILLVSSLLAGVTLVRQNQNPREKAYDCVADCQATKGKGFKVCQCQCGIENDRCPATKVTSETVGNSQSTCDTAQGFAWCSGCGGFCIKVSGTTCAQEIANKCGEGSIATTNPVCDANSKGAVVVNGAAGQDYFVECDGGKWVGIGDRNCTTCLAKMADLNVPEYLKTEFDKAKAAELELLKQDLANPYPAPILAPISNDLEPEEIAFITKTPTPLPNISLNQTVMATPGTNSFISPETQKLQEQLNKELLKTPTPTPVFNRFTTFNSQAECEATRRPGTIAYSQCSQFANIAEKAPLPKPASQPLSQKFNGASCDQNGECLSGTCHQNICIDEYQIPASERIAEETGLDPNDKLVNIFSQDPIGYASIRQQASQLTETQKIQVFQETNDLGDTCVTRYKLDNPNLSNAQAQEYCTIDRATAVIAGAGLYGTIRLLPVAASAAQSAYTSLTTGGKVAVALQAADTADFVVTSLACTSGNRSACDAMMVASQIQGYGAPSILADTFEDSVRLLSRPRITNLATEAVSIPSVLKNPPLSNVEPLPNRFTDDILDAFDTIFPSQTQYTATIDIPKIQRAITENLDGLTTPSFAKLSNNPADYGIPTALDDFGFIRNTGPIGAMGFGPEEVFLLPNQTSVRLANSLNEAGVNIMFPDVTFENTIIKNFPLDEVIPTTLHSATLDDLARLASNPVTPKVANVADNVIAALPSTSTLTPDSPSLPQSPSQISFSKLWDDFVAKPVGDFVFENSVPKSLDTPLSKLTNPEVDALISTSSRYVEPETAKDVYKYFETNYYPGNQEFRPYTAGLNTDVYRFKYEGVDYMVKIPSYRSSDYVGSTINGQRLITKQGLLDNMAPTTFVDSVKNGQVGIQKFIEGDTYLLGNTKRAEEAIDLIVRSGLGVSDPKLNIIYSADGPIIIDQEGFFLIENAKKLVKNNPNLEPGYKFWIEEYNNIYPSTTTTFSKVVDSVVANLTPTRLALGVGTTGIAVIAADIAFDFSDLGIRDQIIESGQSLWSGFINLITPDSERERGTVGSNEIEKEKEIKTANTDTETGFGKVINQNASLKLQSQNDNIAPTKFYTQTDPELADYIIETSTGPRSFRLIGCGPTAVSNIINQLGISNTSPTEIADSLGVIDWGQYGTNILQDSTLLKKLNSYGVETEIYNKSFYNFDKYTSQNDLLLVGGEFIYQGKSIPHISYLELTGNNDNIILKDNLFIQDATCKVTGDANLACSNPSGETLTINLENSPIYLIQPPLP